IELPKLGRARGGEIAYIRVERTLVVVDLLDQFRDEKIQIRVALAMSMRTQVDRHAVHRGGEIRSVIEIEAAQKILVGLAVAGMLRDDHAGNDLEQFAAAQERPRLELGRADDALRSRNGHANQIGVAALNDDGGELS